MNTKLKLQKYKNKFEEWDDNRIKRLYERLKQDEVLTFQIVALESCDQLVKEIKTPNAKLKSNHFDELTTEAEGTCSLLFWERIDSSLFNLKEQDEYNNFKKWFSNLLTTYVDDGGLSLRGSHFIVEWKELIDYGYSFDELWECLESEGLVC